MKRIETAKKLLRSERGMAVPAMLAVLTVMLAIVGVAATTSIQAQQGSVRDQNTKEALAVADTGINQALLRYNLVAPVAASPCLVAGAGGVMTQTGPQADGWCAPVSGSSGGHAYVYRTRHVAGETLEIVSTGTADGISRRVELTGSASTGSNVFKNAGAIGRDWIQLDSNATAHADLGTNGDITVNSNGQICGDAQHGIGQDLVLLGDAEHLGPGCIGAGTETEGLITLPPVSQGDAATNNSNGRFWASTCATPPCDTRTGGSSASWNASTRTLTLDSNSSATLGGAKPYSFCRLRLLSNSTFFVANGATVRIFFDSPEACNLPSGTAQLEMSSNTRIVATSGDATSAQFLFVGSDTRSTRIQLDSNAETNGTCDHHFVIYAPRTDISIDSNSSYCGLIAGKTLHLDSNAELIQSANAGDFVLPGAAPHYTLDRYAECTGVANAPPDENC
jgi:hypothetical protein